MPKLDKLERAITRARAEAAFLVLRHLLKQMDGPARAEIGRLAHAEARDIGRFMIQEEVCDLLDCPAEHSHARQDRLTATGRHR